MTSYVIRGGQQGKARLRLIGETLQPSTLALLADAGIKKGMACLDVGCGGGDVSLDLARLVGPQGSVLGIDADGVKLALAQQDAASEGFANLIFDVRDATALGVEDSYDLVYARFLLTHLRDPLLAVQQMVRAAKPGGVVVLEDLDHDAVFCYPACAALERHISLYGQVARAKGADPQIGPKLPELLRQAGVHAIQLRVVQPTFMQGEAKRIHQITLENISEAVVAAGLGSQAEVAAVAAELDAFAQNPHTLISFPRIFQVWGRVG